MYMPTRTATTSVIPASSTHLYRLILTVGMMGVLYAHRTLLSATNLQGMLWSWDMGGLTVHDDNCQSNMDQNGVWLHWFAGCGTCINPAAHEPCCADLRAADESAGMGRGWDAGSGQHLGVACGATGVHDGAQVLGLGRDGLCWVLPAQLQEVFPVVHFQPSLLLHVLRTQWDL